MSPLQEAIDAVLAHQWHGPREQLAALERLVKEARTVAQPAEPVAERVPLTDEQIDSQGRYWLENRSAIIDCLARNGYELLSSSSGWTLHKLPAARTGGGNG